MAYPGERTHIHYRFRRFTKKQQHTLEHRQIGSDEGEYSDPIMIICLILNEFTFQNVESFQFIDMLNVCLHDVKKKTNERIFSNRLFVNHHS